MSQLYPKNIRMMHYFSYDIIQKQLFYKKYQDKESQTCKQLTTNQMEPEKQQKKIKMTQQMIIDQLFHQPCSSKKIQFIHVLSLHHKGVQSYRVKNQTKIVEITKKWIGQNNVCIRHQSQGEEQMQQREPFRYVLVYKKGEQVIIIQGHQTFADVKSKLQMEILTQNIAFQICHESQCKLQRDQALNYQQFCKNHQQCITIPIKILFQQQPQKSYYFYVQKLNSKSKIKALIVQIKDTLKTKVQPQYRQKIEFELSKQDSHQKEQLKHEINKNQKTMTHSKVTMTQEQQTNLVTKVFPVGQLVLLRFMNKDIRIQRDKNVIKNDFYVVIQYYQRLKDKDIQGKQFKLKKHKIKRKYSQIYQIKVSTILKQQSVQDPLLTSIILNDWVIRPFQEFKKIMQYKQLEGHLPTVKFVCIPQNFLYYLEINDVRHYKQVQRKGKSMLSILQQFPPIRGNTIIKQGQYPKLQKACGRRVQNLSKTVHKDLQEQHKQIDFIEPIFLYSSIIYGQLNKLLRQTSIALFDRNNITQVYWHYYFCSKLLGSLSKLPNTMQIVYRGTQNYDHGCEEGEVLEWNSFISTSSKESQAMRFIEDKEKMLYLFVIQTYSGRRIQFFSKHRSEQQVLILPYTRFKVLKVQKIQLKKSNSNNEEVKDIDNKKQVDTMKYTRVEVLQFPIPKKIPGHVVVWIDNNYGQNYNLKYYKLIVKELDLSNFDLVQLKQNHHLKLWLNEYRQILLLPNIKIHFITKMNFTKGEKGQGIQTLQIIRSFNNKCRVIFFISKIKSKIQQLRKAGKDKDQNCFVEETVKNLKRIFFKQFLNDMQQKYVLNWLGKKNTEKSKELINFLLGQK